MLGPWEIQLLPWTLQVFRQRGSWHEDSIGEPLWFGATFVQNVELGRFWRIEWNLVKPTAMYCEIVDCDSILTGRCQCWFNGQDWNIENLDVISKNVAFVQKCYTPKAILLPFDDHNFGRIPATGDFRYWVAPSRDTEMSFGSMAQGVDGDWMAEMWLRELGTNDNKRKKNRGIDLDKPTNPNDSMSRSIPPMLISRWGWKWRESAIPVTINHHSVSLPSCFLSPASCPLSSLSS